MAAIRAAISRAALARWEIRFFSSGSSSAPVRLKSGPDKEQRVIPKPMLPARDIWSQTDPAFQHAADRGHDPAAGRESHHADKAGAPLLRRNFFHLHENFAVVRGVPLLAPHPGVPAVGAIVAADDARLAA